MTTLALLNSMALLLNFSGLVLLFRHGLPGADGPILPPGYSHAGHDDWLANGLERTGYGRGTLGLIFLLIGTLVQMAVGFASLPPLLEATAAIK